MAKRTNQNVVERDTGIQMPIGAQTFDNSSNKKSKSSATKKRAPGGKNVNKSDIKKQNSGNNNNRKKSVPQKAVAPKQHVKMNREIWFVLTFGLMIFMTLSNFGMCGVVGRVMSDFFFGIFGIVQYVMPVAFFIAVVFLIMNQYSLISIKKVVASFVFLMMISAFTQVISHDSNLTIMDLMSVAIKNHLSGGIIGGGFGLYMKKWFSMFGAIIIIFCGMVLSGIMLSQKSLVDFFRQMLYGIQEYMQEKNATYPYDIDYEEVDENAPAQIPQDLSEEMVIEMPVPQPEKKVEKKAARKKVQPEKESVTTKIKEKRQEKKIQKASKRRAEDCDEVLKELEIQIPDSLIEEEVAEEISAPTFTHNESILRKSAVKELHANDFPLVGEEEDEYQEMPSKRKLYDIDFSQEEEKIVAQTTKAEEKPVKKQAKKPKKKTVKKEVEEVQDFYEVQPAEGDDYIFPPISLLSENNNKISADHDRQLKNTAQLLKDTLASFGVNVTITDISCGPSVTRYEMKPEQGTKVSKIVNLSDDIKMHLEATDIRIEAPIPGKAAIGIEVPNKESMTVHFRDLIESRAFRGFRSRLAFAVGKDIAGETIVSDLAKMPHLLIAGATGSGKSVCINTLVMSILYKARPNEVKLIMIDPKMVELSVYNGIPHLLIPVVTDAKKASGALNWAVAEMTDRYEKFTRYGVRNISGYNQKITDLEKLGEIEEGSVERMPQIVIIVDELADLMMVAPGEVEDAIVRLSQLARAAGIHLVIATQRPSVNVITGLIKANVPSRIAFSVSSGVDSRTIIDMNGAEKLLGKGDMLFYPTGYQKPVRVQGAFVSDNEVADVVEFLKSNEEVAVYDEEVTKNIETSMRTKSVSQEQDEYFEAAARFFIEKDKATIGMMQRMFKIGFNRAARIMDQLADAGIVGPEEGTKPRKVLMSEEQLEQYFEEYL